MYHQLSTWIIDKYFQDEELEAEKRAYVLYYLENILAGTEKILLVLVSACLLGVLAETAAMLLSYTVVRRKSFGWHARKSHHCTWVSLLTFVFVPWLLKEVEWNRFFGDALSAFYHSDCQIRSGRYGVQSIGRSEVKKSMQITSYLFKYSVCFRGHRTRFLSLVNIRAVS